MYIYIFFFLYINVCVSCTRAHMYVCTVIIAFFLYSAIDQSVIYKTSSDSCVYRREHRAIDVEQRAPTTKPLILLSL